MWKYYGLLEFILHGLPRWSGGWTADLRSGSRSRAPHQGRGRVRQAALDTGSAAFGPRFARVWSSRGRKSPEPRTVLAGPIGSAAFGPRFARDWSARRRWTRVPRRSVRGSRALVPVEAGALRAARCRWRRVGGGGRSARLYRDLLATATSIQKPEADSTPGSSAPGRWWPTCPARAQRGVIVEVATWGEYAPLHAAH